MARAIDENQKDPEEDGLEGQVARDVVVKAHRTWHNDYRQNDYSGLSVVCRVVEGVHGGRENLARMPTAKSAPQAGGAPIHPAYWISVREARVATASEVGGSRVHVVYPELNNRADPRGE